MSTRRNPLAGILSGPIDDPPERRLAEVYPLVEAVPGMAVGHRASGFTGVLVRVEGGGAEIRGRTSLERVFRLSPGAFSVDGRAVSLVRPASAGPSAATPSWRGPLAGMPGRGITFRNWCRSCCGILALFCPASACKLFPVAERRCRCGCWARARLARIWRPPWACHSPLRVNLHPK